MDSSFRPWEKVNTLLFKKIIEAEPFWTEAGVNLLNPNVVHGLSVATPLAVCGGLVGLHLIPPFPAGLIAVLILAAAGHCFGQHYRKNAEMEAVKKARETRLMAIENHSDFWRLLLSAIDSKVLEQFYQADNENKLNELIEKFLQGKHLFFTTKQNQISQMISSRSICICCNRSANLICRSDDRSARGARG